MALIKCPECSKDISEKAPACPHCGFPVTASPQPKAKQIPQLDEKWEKWSTDAAKGAPPANKMTPAVPDLHVKTASNKNYLGCLGVIVLVVIIGIISNEAGCNSPDDGSFQRMYKAEDALKSSLRDPSSYERVDSHSYSLENGGIRLIIQYRAKNGFGGYGEDSASFDFDASGNLKK